MHGLLLTVVLQCPALALAQARVLELVLAMPRGRQHILSPPLASQVSLPPRTMPIRSKSLATPGARSPPPKRLFSAMRTTSSTKPTPVSACGCGGRPCLSAL